MTVKPRDPRIPAPSEERNGTVLAWRLRPPPAPRGWPLSTAGTAVLLLTAASVVAGGTLAYADSARRWSSALVALAFVTMGVTVALALRVGHRRRVPSSAGSVRQGGQRAGAGLSIVAGFVAFFTHNTAPRGWHIATVVCVGLLLLAVSLLLAFPMRAGIPRRQRISKEFRSWDDLVDQLRNSPDPLEREHVFGGIYRRTGGPFLLHDTLSSCHIALWGATRSGKSSRMLMPLCIQKVRRRNCRIVYFDLKGSKPEFGALGIACRRARVDFRWLTKEAPLCSYVLNVLDQPEWRTLTLDEKAELLLAAMSLDYGDAESGTAYFGAQAEDAIRGALRLRPDFRSFRELDDIIREPGFAERIGMSRRDFENCGALRSMLSRLRSGLAFNWVDGDPGGDRVAEGAITISQLLNEPGVLYCRLPATLEPTSARVLPRLMTRMLVAAARRQGGARQPTILVFDEAQETLQRSFATIFKQARDLKISLWLAFQNLSDLEVAGPGMSDVVLGNTSVRIFFSATDKGGRDYAALVSGITRRMLRAFGWTVTQTNNGTNSGNSNSLHEVEVPRLGPEEINWLNATEGVCVVEASPQSGYTRLTRPEFVAAPHFCSPGEYKRLCAIPWPPANVFTVVNGDLPPGNSPPPVRAESQSIPNGGAASVEQSRSECSPAAASATSADDATESTQREPVDLRQYLLQLAEPAAQESVANPDTDIPD